MTVSIGYLPLIAAGVVLLAWWLVGGIWADNERHWLEKRASEERDRPSRR